MYKFKNVYKKCYIGNLFEYMTTEVSNEFHVYCRNEIYNNNKHIGDISGNNFYTRYYSHRTELCDSLNSEELKELCEFMEFIKSHLLV